MLISCQAIGLLHIIIIIIAYAYYSFQCARHILSTLHIVSHLIITTDLGGMHCCISTLQMKKMKPREVQELAPGHIVIEWKSLDVNQGSQFKCGF